MFDDVIESVEDTFEDLSDGFKKMDKKKVFLVLCAGAGVLGLVTLMRNKSGEKAETYETVIGAGDDIPYTYAGGGGGAGADEGFNNLVDEYNQNLENLGNEYNSSLSEMESMFNSQLSSIQDDYSAQLKETETYYADQYAMLNTELTQAQEQSAYVGRYDSSVNYSALITDAVNSGAKAGSTQVADLAIARATKITNEGMTQYSNSYNKEVDYSSAIARAKENGAPQSVIDQLTRQREAKIVGEGMTQYYHQLSNNALAGTGSVSTKPATTTNTSGSSGSSAKTSGSSTAKTSGSSSTSGSSTAKTSGSSGSSAKTSGSTSKTSSSSSKKVDRAKQATWLH